MTYQPSRARLAERGAALRALSRPISHADVRRAGEPQVDAAEDGPALLREADALLIRYGVALAIERGHVFDAADRAELAGDRSAVFICRGADLLDEIEIPEHARGLGWASPR